MLLRLGVQRHPSEERRDGQPQMATRGVYPQMTGEGISSRRATMQSGDRAPQMAVQTYAQVAQMPPRRLAERSAKDVRRR